jgi:hypothetical protein
VGCGGAEGCHATDPGGGGGNGGADACSGGGSMASISPEHADVERAMAIASASAPAVRSPRMPARLEEKGDAGNRPAFQV